MLFKNLYFNVQIKVFSKIIYFLTDQINLIMHTIPEFDNESIQIYKHQIRFIEPPRRAAQGLLVVRAVSGV